MHSCATFDLELERGQSEETPTRQSRLEIEVQSWRANIAYQLIRAPSDREVEVAVAVHKGIRAWREQAAALGTSRLQQLETLANVLAQFGLKTLVRSCPGGGHGQECFTNLPYNFIRIAPPDSSCLPEEMEDIVVDPDFKEQFRVQPRLDWYDEILTEVPDVFVGRSSRLISIVRGLCCIMDRAFKSKGCATPPWRRQEALLSKWVPKEAVDLAIPVLDDSAIALPGAPAACQGPRPLSRSQSDVSDCKPRLHSIPAPRQKITGFDCPACENLSAHLTAPGAGAGSSLEILPPRSCAGIPPELEAELLPVRTVKVGWMMGSEPWAPGSS